MGGQVPPSQPRLSITAERRCGPASGTRYPEANAFALLEVRERKLPDDWQTFYIRSLFGGALAGQKKFAEALLVSGYEGMKQREAKISASHKVRLKEALERLVRFYTDWGQPEKAAAWQQKLDQHNQAEAQKKSAGSPKSK